EVGIEALRRAGVETSNFPSAYLESALQNAQEKGRLFKELPYWVDFFFLPDNAVVFDPEARDKALTTAAKPLVTKLRERFAALAEFTPAAIEAALKQL